MTTSDYLTADVGGSEAGRRNFMNGVARNYGGAHGLPSGPQVPDLPDSVAQRVLAMRTGATMGARQREGTYPLVVFVIPLGGTGASDFFWLAEQMATGGRIVVSGAPLTNVPAGTSMDDYMDLIKQSADRVLEAGLTLPGVDKSRAIALDPTGSTALVLDVERPRLAGIVAFSEMPFGERQLPILQQAAPQLRPAVLYVPLNDPPPNAAFFSQLRAGRVTTLTIPGGTHGLMSAWGTLFQKQLGKATSNYDAALHRVLEFIDSAHAR